MNTDADDFGGLTLVNGEIYACKPYEHEVLRLDAETGEMERVFEMPADWDWGYLGYSGGKYTFSASINREQHFYCADSLDAPLTEYTSYTYMAGYPTHMPIVGESGESFMLLCGFDTYSTTITSPSGELISHPVAEPRYAMITFDDYFAGNPNYRDITEVT